MADRPAIAAIKYEKTDTIPAHLKKVAAIQYAPSDTIPDNLVKYALSTTGLLLKTGQTSVYHAGDDGSYQKGVVKNYTVLSTGQHTGTTAVDNPEYAAATIAFVAATKKITDTANLLATFKTGDTLRVRGSVGNDGVYTVATGNVAGEIVTTEALVDEAAGAFITLCKRASPANNAVVDNNTGLTWRRYSTGGPAEKVGPTSVGSLVWYDATKCYVLHAAGADLQIIASPATLRIVGGAGEIARYFVGACLDLTGFANAVNNLPGYVVTAVAVNGADLDISLQTFGGTLIAEAAAGSRSITLVCQSIFSYLAAMNAAGLGGYSDWRVPNISELGSLQQSIPTSGRPDGTAFPSWPTSGFWFTSSSLPADTYYKSYVEFTLSNQSYLDQTTPALLALVRGGS